MKKNSKGKIDYGNERKFITMELKRINRKVDSFIPTEGDIIRGFKKEA